jgi:hypothetical protein
LENGRKVHDLAPEKKVAKSKEVQTGCNLAESSKEGYDSKIAVLPMMMIVLEKYIGLCFKVTLE